MMRKIKFIHSLIIGSIILLTAYSCSDSEEETVLQGLYYSESYTPKYSAEQLLKKLESAYKKKSVADLEAFVTEWNSSIKAIPEEEMSEIEEIKTVYEIFRAFRGTPDSSKYYYPIQNKIHFICLPAHIDIDTDVEDMNIKHPDVKLELYNTKNTINNFRPLLNTEENILYFTEEYNKALDAFLSINSEEKLDHLEQRERVDFLLSCLPVFPSLGECHYEHPKIHYIYFNKELTKAFINYRMVYNHYEYVMQKIDGKWKRVAGRLTGTE
ncbi:hypothetical protein LJC12_00385 [Odoribacter sp. OttesenSCG-928-J03]|nr:hypothetical protein [Odoribacter sp. OttesenSCG-928-J03]